MFLRYCAKFSFLKMQLLSFRMIPHIRMTNFTGHMIGFSSFSNQFSANYHLFRYFAEKACSICKFSFTEIPHIRKRNITHHDTVLVIFTFQSFQRMSF